MLKDFAQWNTPLLDFPFLSRGRKSRCVVSTEPDCLTFFGKFCRFCKLHDVECLQDVEHSRTSMQLTTQSIIRLTFIPSDHCNHSNLAQFCFSLQLCSFNISCIASFIKMSFRIEVVLFNISLQHNLDCHNHIQAQHMLLKKKQILTVPLFH